MDELFVYLPEEAEPLFSIGVGFHALFENSSDINIRLLEASSHEKFVSLDDVKL